MIADYLFIMYCSSKYVYFRYMMTYIFYILHIHHPTFTHCQLRIYASIIVLKLSSTYQSNSCTSVFLEKSTMSLIVKLAILYFCKHLTSFLHAIIQGSTNFGKWKKGVQKFRHLLMTKSNLQIINVSCIRRRKRETIWHAWVTSES